MVANDRRAEQIQRDKTLNGEAITDTWMALKQILVFILGVAVCVCKSPCYNKTELEGAAKKKLHSHYIQAPLPTQASAVSDSCPLELFRHYKDIKDRSISPWAYVQREMPDHFPSTYYEARCLCEGCIVEEEEGPVESSDYNSAPVTQSRTFLKRELCEEERIGEEKRYWLKPVTVNVNVACTCVRPNRRIAS